MTVQKLSRREALRGTGVAALAAGAAVMPFVAAATPAARDPRERIDELLDELAAALEELHPGARVVINNNHARELIPHERPHYLSVCAWADDTGVAL